MDITPLFPSFTGANLPPACTRLWIEMMKTHGNLSKDDIKTVTKYLDDKLRKYKSDDTSPLMLLNCLVNSCSASVLVNNCTSWMDKLSKIIQVNCEEEIISLACEAVINIIPYVVQNSELNRQFCGSVLTNLVTVLLNNDHVDLHILHCLREVMKTFHGPCRQFQKEIEKFVTTIFLETTSEPLQREAAQCFIILPVITSEPECGWTECFKNLLATIHDVLTELFEPVERGDSIWKSENTKSLSFPAISNSQPIKQLQSLQQRLNLLCYCISEMLSVGYSNIKQIPVKDIIGFVTRVLIVTPFSIKCVTSDNLMLAGVLPLLHEYVFKVLHSLIAACRKLLIPESSTICKLIIKGLKWTSRAQTETTSDKSFSDLRCQIYSTLKLWAEIMTTTSGLKEFSNELYTHFVNDMRNQDKKIQLENTTDEKNRRKRKRGCGFSGVGSVGPIKENPLVNNSICMNCLKALKAVHFAIGSTIPPAVYSEICTSTIHLVCDVQKTISNRPTPYDDPKCRQALYDVILSFVLASPQQTGSCIQLCMKIFSRGRQDPYHKISSFCVEAQAICQQLIHPRLPSLQFDFGISRKQIERNSQRVKSSEEERNGIDAEEIEENGLEIEGNIETSEEIGENGLEMEGNTEITEELERNGPEMEGNSEITEGLKQNGLEIEENIAHENKRSKIMSAASEDTAQNLANDDIQVLAISETEENSIADSDIEIVSSLNSSPPKKLEISSPKLTLENSPKLPSKARPIDVNKSPVSSEDDEANLTVEEMLQDFVSEDQIE